MHSVGMMTVLSRTLRDGVLRNAPVPRAISLAGSQRSEYEARSRRRQADPNLVGQRFEGQGQLSSYDDRVTSPSFASTGPSSGGSRSFYLFFATCHPGLEEAVAKELTGSQIGIPEADVKASRAGVHFRCASFYDGLRAAMWLRTAIRVLATLWQGDLDLDSARHPGDVIYESASEAADWAGLLPASGMTVAVSGVISGDCGKLTSSQLLQARIRDAVCDAVRESKGWRPPPVGREQPTLPLHAHVRSGRMTLYRDVGGGSLHRRGYRSAMHKAALNEAAAAGCLVLAGWPEVVANKPDAMLLDPFCGSGTILIEAALMALGRAPGEARAWPLVAWPDVDERRWREEVLDPALEAKHEADSADVRFTLLGGDVHEGALSLADQDARAAGVREHVLLQKVRCGDIKALPRTPDLVVSNPPWGVRLTEGEESAWDELGTMLKGHCVGAQAYLLSGNRQVTKHLRLKAGRKWPITIGDVDTRLLQYEIR